MLPGFDAHALQQIVDQSHQAQHAALDIGEQLALRVGRHVAQAIAQQFDRCQLCRQRRTKFVRDVAEHAVARAACGFQIGLIAQDLHLHALDRRGAQYHCRTGAAVAQAQHFAQACLRRGTSRNDRAIAFRTDVRR